MPHAASLESFADLDLTPMQQYAVQAILRLARAQGLSPQQVNAQIAEALTPAQRAIFSRNPPPPHA